jgi:predicted O-methyltransferase YrrM
MEGLLAPNLEQYIYDLLPVGDAILQEMEQYAAEHQVPIVGPAVGRIFFFLARISGARSVCELGSAIGYSTLWWARSLAAGGRVIYTDSDPANAERARQWLMRAGVAHLVEFEIGDAVDILERQKGEFDIVFCDIDKTGYPRALEAAETKVRRGGLYVADNVLWSGRVAEDSPQEDTTRAIIEHNRRLFESKAWYPVLFPIRDGVAAAIRL